MDTYDFLADPRTLTMAERQAVRDEYERDQNQWLSKLQALAEQPKPEQDFPAFLLATKPFADLARKLESANERNQLPLEVADELDWFLRAFANYMRSRDGEEIFPESPRMTG